MLSCDPLGQGGGGIPLNERKKKNFVGMRQEERGKRQGTGGHFWGGGGGWSSLFIPGVEEPPGLTIHTRVVWAENIVWVSSKIIAKLITDRPFSGGNELPVTDAESCCQKN